MAVQRVLITGAAGRIGTMLRPRLARPGRVIRLLDVEPVGAVAANEEVVTASITDLVAMTDACQDVDVVVHLAGIPTEAPWTRIRDVNIDGTFVAFEAARLAGVSRLVFASSNHAVGYFARTDAPAPDYAFPVPDTHYGVSKVVGEALGSLYHHRYGMDVVCLRIGACAPEPVNVRMLSIWLSPDDAGRLVEASITAPSPGYRLVWGVSANTRGWFSLAEGQAIGYEPVDDAEAYAAPLLDREGEPDLTVLPHAVVGGDMAGPEFDRPGR